MIRTGLLCALVLVASCLAQEREDDGSYRPEEYEAPYQDTNQLNQGYQQPSYRAQPQQSYQPQQASYRSSGQSYQSDPRNAAILSEARYLSNDGKFGASYSQEDGVEFKEESDPDGTRRGQYSYVDPSGQRRTVTYTAGKHGFQASGDHLPSAPVGSVQQAPQPQRQYQPAPQQQRQYQPAPQPQRQYQPAPQQQRQYEPAPQQQYEPAPQQQYRPQSQTRYVQQEPQQGGHPDVSGQTAGGYSISSTY